MAIPRRWRTLHVLREHGAELLTQTRVLGFPETGVEVESQDGQARAIAADHVLLAEGIVPDGRLARSLVGKDFELHQIGDGHEIGYLEGALRSAAQVGRAL